MKSRLVALHGFLGCGADWDVVRAITQHDFKWICPNLFAPGVEEEKEVMQNYEGKAWLVGYSLGGRLALQWLINEPARWHGALLLSTNPGNFQTSADRQARRQADAAWADAFRKEPWELLMRRWNEQRVLAGGMVPVRDEKNFDRHKLAAALEVFSVADQWTDAAALRMPLAWMAGERDRKFSLLLDSLRNAHFPGVFHVAPGSGHRLLHEAPGAVAQALDLLVL